MSQAVLCVEGVSKHFAGIRALEQVSIEVRDHEVVGLVGANGAGKSTLLKVLAGLCRPDSGRIVLRGQAITLKDVCAAADAGIGMVFQEQSLLPNLSVAENILLGHEGAALRAGFYNWSALHALAAAQLDKLGCTISPSAQTDTLSFAERQVVELAKVLTLEERAQHPPVILLDEPTSMLDAGQLEIVLARIERLRGRACVVFVSHRLDEVLRLCDRIYVMRDGRCVAERAREGCKAADLQQLMLGPGVGDGRQGMPGPASQSAKVDSARLRFHLIAPHSHPLSRGVGAYASSANGLDSLSRERERFDPQVCGRARLPSPAGGRRVGDEGDRKSSGLDKRPPLQGANRLASLFRYAGGQHAVRNPCFSPNPLPQAGEGASFSLAKMGEYLLSPGEGMRLHTDSYRTNRLSVHALSRAGSYQSVSFELRAGEVLGIAGVEGSGRESLCRTLFGAEAPDSGEIVLDGQPVRLARPADAVRLGIGYVPAERHVEGIVAGLSVRENMTLAHLDQLRRGPFIDLAREKALVGSWIARLRIKPCTAHTPVHHLSGGNQQKLVLAKWLIARTPKILILDHPLRGLDIGAKAEIVPLIRQLATSGIGIVLIADTFDELIALSDAILVMRDGVVSGHFPAAAAKPSELQILERMV